MAMPRSILPTIMLAAAYGYMPLSDRERANGYKRSRYTQDKINAEKLALKEVMVKKAEAKRERKRNRLINEKRS